MHTTATHFEAPTTRLVPSPLNPRKTIGDLADLTESVRTHGVLQSLLVRKHPTAAVTKTGEAPLEIVCGERRWRAAQAAGVTSVPVVMRELDDSSALEAMVIENSQRADVHPLEEADGIAALRDHSRSVEEIAAKLGRPPAFVYRRLVLRQLGEKARKAFATGKVTTAAAETLATVPAGKLQDEALKDMLQRAWNDPVSARNAREVAGRFRLELAEASWKLDDAELVAPAGACSSCPKRTGAQPALFEDETKDRCTDPTCFADKKSAYAKRAVHEAQAAGRRVLTGAEAKKLWPNSWSHTPEGAYVDLDAKSGAYGEGKKWRGVLGKRAPADAVAVAVNPHSGEVHELVERGLVKLALEAEPKKGDPPAPGSSARSSSSGVTPAEKKRAQVAKAKTAGHRAAAEELRTKLDDPKALKGKLRDILELVGFGVIERVYGVEAFERIAKRNGWTAQGDEDPKELIERSIAGKPAEHIAAALVEILVEEQLRQLGHTYDDVEDSFVARVMGYMGVDWLAHEQAAIATLEERSAKKKTSKKKASKKAKAKK